MAHAIMHQDPFGEVGGVRQVERQRGQVEVALLRLGVVAFDAVLVNELSNRPRRVTGKIYFAEHANQHQFPRQPVDDGAIGCRGN